MAASSTAQPSNPFIRQLASSDRQTRDRALASLRTYLRRSTAFTPLELLKLWKGLFYCMWMSDKPRTQQRLARDLAELVEILSPMANLLGFIDAFWKTMAREWGNIDALRMDKFLYLVRCYVGKGFEIAARQGWKEEERLEAYLEILQGTPMNARDSKIPNGLRYHVVDIYVDELDKADTQRDAPLETVLRPLRQLGEKSFTKPVKKRVQEALDDERLSDWTGAGVEEDDNKADDVPTSAREVNGGGADAVQSEDDEFDGFGD